MRKRRAATKAAAKAEAETGFVKLRGVALPLAIALVLGVGLALGTASRGLAEERAPVSGQRGMVASSVGPAVPVGAEILARGGNAVDAAIAVGFACGCAHQFSSGIGGGGFFLVWNAAQKRAYALDSREVAPQGITPERLKKADGSADPNALREGGLAVAVPSLVQGFEEVHRRFGKLPWRDVVAPAAALCRSGVEVSPYHHQVLESAREKVARYPETVAVQYARGGAPLEVGAKLVQEDLAESYERIAAGGAKVMRTGSLAEAMVEAAADHQGVLSAADLASYQPIWREPVRGMYRGYEVISMPPPSSGGVHVIQMLNALERFDLRALGANSGDEVHVLSEVMKLAFADRAVLLGDPDFVPVPVEWLTSKRYGEQMARRIAPPFWTRAPWRWGKPEVLRVRLPSPRPVDDHGTTHISVVDAQGNAVSLTQTVNTLFGSGITPAGTGIVLNNEMDDFALAPGVPNSFGLVGSRANAVEAGKRPLSSMSPTLLLKDGELFMVLGSPQGPYIITTVLQTVVNVVDFGMNVQQAAAAPRAHHQWQPDTLQMEPSYRGEVVKKLERMGHPVKVSDSTFGASVAILRDAATGTLYGAEDPRRDTRAIAP